MSCCSPTAAASLSPGLAPATTYPPTAVDAAATGGGPTAPADLSVALQQLTAAVAQLKAVVDQLAASQAAAGAGALGAPVAASGGGGITTSVAAQQVQAEAQQPAAPKPAVAAAPASPATLAGGYTMANLVPNQYKDGATLSSAEAASACGPAAATALARFLGKSLTFDQVADVARKHGWNSDGMSTGSLGEQATLAEMGIDVERVTSVDWNRVRSTVQSGKPVIVATDGHYMVASEYNAATGEFNFGNSASILKHSGGRSWFKPDEISGLKTGDAVTTLYLK